MVNCVLLASHQNHRNIIITSTRNQLKLTDTGQNNIRNEKSVVEKSKSSFKIVYLNKNQQNNGKKLNLDDV